LQNSTFLIESNEPQATQRISPKEFSIFNLQFSIKIRLLKSLPRCIGMNLLNQLMSACQHFSLWHHFYLSRPAVRAKFAGAKFGSSQSR